MMTSINAITSSAVTQVTQSRAANLAQPTGGDDGFKNLLVDSIKQVNQMQHDADTAVEALFTGQDVNPAEVLTAVQKADIAFRLTMQMRNKAMEVYREIQDIRI